MSKMKIDRKYIRSITEVSKIIELLSEADKAKIPENIKKFFEVNADSTLVEQIKINPEFFERKMSIDTKRFLKIIDYYINK